MIRKLNLVPIILLLLLLFVVSCEVHSLDELKSKCDVMCRDKRYDEALDLLARVYITPEATKSDRINALFVMSIIEDVINKNHAAAIGYINKSIEIMYPDVHPLLYAYKGDYSMHYGVTDSAMYYCKKALALPQNSHDGTVKYVAHYVLSKAYGQMGVPDSARYHEMEFCRVRNRGKLDAYVDIPDEVFDNKIKSIIKTNDSSAHLFLYVALFLVVFLVAYVIIKKKSERRGLNSDIVNKEAFEDKLRTAESKFEKVGLYSVLNGLRIKENELYRIAFAESETLENEMFDSFKEVTAELMRDFDLSGVELLCCYCAYLGFNNNIIAYVSHSTPAAVRKRKERLKQKIHPEYYSLIFDRKN